MVVPKLSHRLEERLSTSKEAQLDSAREKLTGQILFLTGAILAKEGSLLSLIVSSSNPFTFVAAAAFLASYTAAVLAVTRAALLLKNTRDTIARLSNCITTAAANTVDLLNARAALEAMLKMIRATITACQSEIGNQRKLTVTGQDTINTATDELRRAQIALQICQNN